MKATSCVLSFLSIKVMKHHKYRSMANLDISSPAPIANPKIPTLLGLVTRPKNNHVAWVSYVTFVVLPLLCWYLHFTYVISFLLLHVGIQKLHFLIAFGLAMKNALLNKTCILYEFSTKMHAFSKI